MPERVVRRAEARARYGALLDRFAPALLRTDPVADAAAEALGPSPRRAAEMLDTALVDPTAAVPKPVRDLIEQARTFPTWVDDERLIRGGELLFRAGVPGGIALGAKSLLLGYASPAGNKPLVLSGGLTANVSRRLAETAKFVAAVAEPQGILPGGEGFAITLKVRLMHARVRTLVRDRPGWSTEAWGAPINQHDMLATILLFANAWMDGVEALGIHIGPEEAEDFMHLWRTVGHVIGVEHDLLPATRAEGERLFDFIHLTQAPPDEDSRALARAFFEHPVQMASSDRERAQARRRMRAYAGVVRGLLGEEIADGLGVARDRWRFTAPAVRELVRRMERVRRTLPRGRELAVRAGRGHWERVVELGLMGIPAEFALPTRLAAA